jgi:glutaredoxin 2
MKNLTLYHYVHCPFCLRVRFALGYLKISYDSIVLPYNEEKIPVALTGKKMLPIIVFDKQSKNESLDIIAMIDKKNQLHGHHYFERQDSVDKKLNSLGENIHNLAMPYWIWTPEFDENSRRYFQDKKEMKRGPFKNLVKNSPQFFEKLHFELHDFEKNIDIYYQSQFLTLTDILFASHLWGLFIVPEFQFSPKVYNYLMNIKTICNFNYHEDLWR